MLPFQITFTDGQPASDQLIQAVRRAILSGDLRDGDAFPSVRTLSQQLKISPTTAHKSVAVLKAEGLLASRPGIGMLVRSASLPDTEERLALLMPQLQQLVKEAKALQLSEKDLREALNSIWKKNDQS
jgi:DNA-binding transcriptional regulator YhcF (GntR family)